MIAALLLLTALAGDGAGQEQDASARGRQFFAEWRAAEPAERWSRFLAATADDLGLRRVFFELLRTEGELDFLEEIVLYGRDAELALRELASADAPQWIRSAAWCLERRSDSHTWESARSQLLERNDVALGWFEENPPRSAIALELLEELRSSGTEPRSDARYLPAHDPDDVFAALDPRGRIAETFRRSAPASPSRSAATVEIERALEGFSYLFEHLDPWSGHVLELTRERDPLVALAAYRAFTRFRPHEIPMAELWADIGDSSLERARREHALLAWSYGRHTEVYVRLHEIALDSAHPAWTAAVERLGDLGDGFTLLQLDALGDPTLAAILAKIGERERALGPVENARRVQAILERTAWADLTCHPLENALRSWMHEEVGAWAEDDTVAAALRELARSYDPAAEIDAATLFGDLRTRVRDYARSFVR